jgi:tRNA(fMet)-specific endonuclease VapC
MSKIILDTNAYSAFMSGDIKIFDVIINSEKILISSIVLGELFAGFRGGNRFSKNLAELKLFLSKSGVEIIDVTISTAEIFGELKSSLSRKGKMLPINDIWLGAHTVESGAKLVTYDRHFKEFDGLRIWDDLE